MHWDHCRGRLALHRLQRCSDKAFSNVQQGLLHKLSRGGRPLPEGLPSEQFHPASAHPWQAGGFAGIISRCYRPHVSCLLMPHHVLTISVACIMMALKSATSTWHNFNAHTATYGWCLHSSIRYACMLKITRSSISNGLRRVPACWCLVLQCFALLTRSCDDGLVIKQVTHAWRKFPPTTNGTNICH